MEEGIQKKNVSRLNGCGVEEDWLTAFLIESVGVQCWLNHDQRVAHILVVENVAIESSFIRRVVENLEELTSSQVEHELRVESKVLFQSEGGWVIFAIICESRT